MSWIHALEGENNKIINHKNGNIDSTLQRLMETFREYKSIESDLMQATKDLEQARKDLEQARKYEDELEKQQEVYREKRETAQKNGLNHAKELSLSAFVIMCDYSIPTDEVRFKEAYRKINKAIDLFEEMNLKEKYRYEYFEILENLGEILKKTDGTIIGLYREDLIRIYQDAIDICKGTELDTNYEHILLSFRNILSLLEEKWVVKKN